MYTKEEKQRYFAGLREKWKAAKARAEAGEFAELIEEAHRCGAEKISVPNFVIISTEMKAQGLEGLPYVDAKTFNAWKGAGFIVQKGEKSTLKSISWIKAHRKTEDEEDGYLFPKEYHLFHRSQVKPMN